MIDNILLNSSHLLVSSSQMIQKDPKITKYITEVLGIVLNFIYNIVSHFTVANSLGISIILFTIFVRVCMLPLAVKQQKSMIKMQMVQPEVTKIQKKYKDNKDPEVQKKMQAEIQALYSKNGVNPLSGCLPLLIQLPIFISLSYMMSNAYKYIDQLGAIYKNIAVTIATIPNIGTTLKDIAMPKAVVGVTLDFTQAKDLAFVHVADIEKTLNKFATIDWTKIINMAPPETAADISTQVANLRVIEHFCGIDLTSVAGLTWPGIIIPILAVVTTVLSSYIATSMTSATMTDSAKQQQKYMLIIMPIIMGWTTINLSAGVGLYWITSSVFQTIQQIVINRHVRKSSGIIGGTVVENVAVKKEPKAKGKR